MPPLDLQLRLHSYSNMLLAFEPIIFTSGIISSKVKMSSLNVSIRKLFCGVLF